MVCLNVDLAEVRPACRRLRPLDSASRSWRSKDWIQPKNGSRSSLESAIFFTAQPLAAIDDFTIRVRCGAVQRSRIGKRPNHGFSLGRSFAGAKAQLSFQPFAAQLKPCPCYKAAGFGGSQT